MSRQGPVPGEIYIEFHPVGQQVKVTAIDASTGIEVVVIGPSKAASADLKNLAVRKLLRRIEREAPPAVPSQARGRVV
ncbi:serine hydroxymethyltransferase [Roseibium polysiphoniae]|uniref:Serine hydroxymethyltransferase n=1 Tax=Roseibium polysiphoniae TaxID=2571221 RepID=A0A944GRV5_9HYPH|nr:serine hydroxymethyltransferase [Roseibium polysiphoniae]MBS8258970.1 serine hydroxymethyltransferase [Roseibium polysiphoniae]